MCIYVVVFMRVYAHTCVGTGTCMYVMCVCACGSQRLGICFDSISITVVEYHEQKQLGEEGVCFSLFQFIVTPSLREDRAVTWRQELIQRP